MKPLNGLPVMAGLALASSAATAQTTPPFEQPQQELPPYVPPQIEPAPPPRPSAQAEAPPPAAAEGIAPVPQVFGEKGEVAFSGALSASFGHLGYSASDASSTTVSVQPAADYFIARNVFIGGAIFFRYSNSETGIAVVTKSTTDGIDLRLGYNAPVGETFSIRPTIALGVWETHYTFTAPSRGYGVSVGGSRVDLGASTDVTETAVYTEIFVPFLVHPAQHFFLGIGPDVFWDLSHEVSGIKNDRFSYGVSSTIGGWI